MIIAAGATALVIGGLFGFLVGILLKGDDGWRGAACSAGLILQGRNKDDALHDRAFVIATSPLHALTKANFDDLSQAYRKLRAGRSSALFGLKLHAEISGDDQAEEIFSEAR